ncbi:DUF6355 family natural product biosynthesis protein [Streptosporangium roseum]|uniref:Uncharacterized protein n=1 Tax=Streptosporangium roseum (strain ATCC 12428 / DSM 43021 / JCM 3005 / KCTC 9067 / NCIMB 10171 / NRRL 2505 / NI 9100) TaxID=479432 RepID=D2AW62_STRRD|nr:DUF6355 family natural product biosynthesis protein [Streptosporangium roseum]ACZ85015.1 hypothetical protein Sros_2028 [Streptosporangium roseum DSM 43021]
MRRHQFLTGVAIAAGIATSIVGVPSSAAASALDGSAATAAAADASAKTSGRLTAVRCGFYEDRYTAWYNHCTSDGSRIKIRVVRNYWPDNTICVGPGHTDLGSPGVVVNAWYTGKLC